MIYKMRYFCLLLLLVGCGKPPQFIDPKALPYAKDFESRYSVSLDLIEISFSDKGFEVDELGYCEMGLGKVVLNSLWWGKLSVTEQSNLVYHELGHCYYNREHRNDLFPDGCPMSIMNEYLLSDACFFAHSTELYWELPNE